MWFSSKKERKKAQLKKNRLHEEIFQLLRLRQREEERVESLKKALKPKTAAEARQGPAGDKVAVIRDRLTNQRRVSRERWNRFAGTSGSGGRGL